MPLMGGRELSEQIRAAEPSLKIQFTSGYYENEENLLEGPEEVTDFMHKPFLHNDLVADVCALLDRGGSDAGVSLPPSMPGPDCRPGPRWAGAIATTGRFETVVPSPSSWPCERVFARRI